jgi:hypothetical protein
LVALGQALGVATGNARNAARSGAERALGAGDGLDDPPHADTPAASSTATRSAPRTGLTPPEQAKNGVAEEHDPPHHAGQKDDTDQEQGEVTHTPNLSGDLKFGRPVLVRM